MHVRVDDLLRHLQQQVLLICSEWLLVCGVWRDCFGCVYQVLIEVDLADVRGVCDEEVREGVVGVCGYFADGVGEDCWIAVRRELA